MQVSRGLADDLGTLCDPETMLHADCLDFLFVLLYLPKNTYSKTKTYEIHQRPTVRGILSCDPGAPERPHRVPQTCVNGSPTDAGTSGLAGKNPALDVRFGDECRSIQAPPARITRSGERMRGSSGAAVCVCFVARAHTHGTVGISTGHVPSDRVLPLRRP